MLAHLHVARWSGGPAACAELLTQAADLVDESDLAFRAELLGFEAFVARAEQDDERLTRALSGLRSLAESHELHWAKAALEQFSHDAYRARAFPEDQLTPLLRAVVRRDESVLPRLLSAGLTGALPELLGFAPGRRILVLAAENALVLEDHGNVVVRTNPPRWCPELLRLLSGKDVSKQALVGKLWGLRSYRAERHDPLLRTTIHRLRALLEPYGKWVQVTPNGYGTSVPVLFVGGGDADGTDAELASFEDDVTPLESAPPFTASPSTNVGAAREREPSERIYAALAQLEHGSVRQLARAAEVSPSTALRALRELVRRKQVLRTGYARATRYRLPGAQSLPS